MDLPLVLQKLGYNKTKTDDGAFWGGPCATSYNTWEELSGKWPENNHPLSGKAIFEAAWVEIAAGQRSKRVQFQPLVEVCSKGYGITNKTCVLRDQDVINDPTPKGLSSFNILCANITSLSIKASSYLAILPVEIHAIALQELHVDV